MYKLNFVGGKHMYNGKAATTLTTANIAAIDTNIPFDGVYTSSMSTNLDSYNNQLYTITDATVVLAASRKICLGCYMTLDNPAYTLNNILFNCIASVNIYSAVNTLNMYPVFGRLDEANSIYNDLTQQGAGLTKYQIVPHKLDIGLGCYHLSCNHDMIDLQQSTKITSTDNTNNNFFGIVIENPGAINSTIYGRIDINCYKYKSGIVFNSPFSQ